MTIQGLNIQNAATTGVIWFRGGLRLEDNTCVYNALKENTQVVCMYTLDDNYLRSAATSARRECSFCSKASTNCATRFTAQGGKFIVRLTNDPAARSGSCGEGRERRTHLC